MKKISRRSFLAAGAATAVAAVLAGCGASSAVSSAASSAAGSAASSAASGAAAGKVYNIGICQLVQHQALDAATKGFRDKLTELLGEGNVKFDEQNAQNEATACATICTGFVSNRVDLILANATPALQAAVNAANGSDIPVLGTSVTDYATALSLKDFNGTTGMNVSGTSDLAPLDQQADVVKELVPAAKQVGIIYCSAEANSAYQATIIEASFDTLGFAYKEYTFSDSNDMQSVVESCAADCDVIYIPTDNTAASNMTIVANVCQGKGIPVICGEENMCKKGGLATLSISYEAIGQKTGEMAFDILTKGADIKTMPIETADTATKEYNPDYAKAIGMTMPSDYTAIDMSAE